MAMADLAAAFAVAPNLLSRHLDQWLTADLWDDRRLAQDFRAAMLWLCLSRLEPDGGDTAEPVMQWLRGEKVASALLRSADISVRISRTNARADAGFALPFPAQGRAPPGCLLCWTHDSCRAPRRPKRHCGIRRPR